MLVMGWHLKSFVQALVAAKRLGMPVLARGDSHLQTQRSALKKAAKAFAYPIFLRFFDAALYVGERSRAYWTHYGYPSARLFFSPHCVDAEWFAIRATAEARTALRARLGLAPDTKVALFAGKLVPFKRPLDLVAAAAQLKAEGANSRYSSLGQAHFRNEIAAAARLEGVTLHHASASAISQRCPRPMPRRMFWFCPQRQRDVGSRRERGASLRPTGGAFRCRRRRTRSCGRRFGRPRVSNG